MKPVQWSTQMSDMSLERVYLSPQPPHSLGETRNLPWIRTRGRHTTNRHADSGTLSIQRRNIGNHGQIST
jgi:hypothetical protein